MIRPVYETQDIWQAAYLEMMGMALLDVAIDEDGRTVWQFCNESDRAWQLGREFRLSHQAVIPVQEFRHAYRRVASAAAAARRGDPIHAPATTE